MLDQTGGCNRVICCYDNLDVIQAMQEGGYSNGAAAATLGDLPPGNKNFKNSSSSTISVKQI